MRRNIQQARKGKISALVAASGLVGALFFAGKEIHNDDTRMQQEAYASSKISDYGTIVYEKNTDAPNMIYVLAQLHRVTSTTINLSKNTPVAQRNIYHIGGILVRERNVRLVLKEGRYASEDYTNKNALSRQQLERYGYGLEIFDNGAVENAAVDNILSKNDNAFSASHLLALKFPDVDLQGWEDEVSLDKAMAAREKRIKDPADEAARAEYGYFKSIRTCNALLNAPEVASREFGAGKVPNMNAAVVIGGGHVREMMSFLDNGHCYARPVGDSPKFVKALDHYKNDFGVKIIVPKIE